MAANDNKTLEERLRARLRELRDPKARRHGLTLTLSVTVAAAVLALIVALAWHSEVKTAAPQGVVAFFGSVTVQPTPQSQPMKRWTDYSQEERQRIRGEVFVLFPEILAPERHRKWSRVHDWLNMRYSIRHDNPRDLFRAAESSPSMSRFQARLLEDREAFRLAMERLSAAELTAAWGRVAPKSAVRRMAMWAEIAAPFIGDLDAERFLEGLRRDD